MSKSLDESRADLRLALADLAEAFGYVLRDWTEGLFFWALRARQEAQNEIASFRTAECSFCEDAGCAVCGMEEDAWADPSSDPVGDVARAAKQLREVDRTTFGACHTDGNCCGPGSYCCAHNAPHDHE